MRPERVIFVTMPSGIFGNGGQTWIGIDLAPSRKAMEERGFEVLQTSIDMLTTFDFRDGDIIVYAASNDPDILGYMKDALYFLQSRCHLIPSYDFLMAYENKGFQEVHRRELNFGNLDGTYAYDLDAHDSPFPFVFKSVAGAGGSGVRLVRKAKDLKAIRRRLFKVSLRRRIILLQRRMKLSRKDYQAYRYRHKGFCRYVAQRFIPDLNCDYRILVSGDRFFAMKRYVRKNDFRASGGGRFDFNAEIPTEVLDFAAEISDTLNTPQLSLDIVHTPKECHLIEYQAMNFGSSALRRSSGYYQLTLNGWVWIKAKSNLSQCYADALAMFINKNICEKLGSSGMQKRGSASCNG